VLCEISRSAYSASSRLLNGPRAVRFQFNRFAAPTPIE
jgi:hypothetical protein